MKGYLLDTDICISFLKNQYFIKEKILEVGIDQCFISEITIAELTYGAEKSGNIEKHMKDVVKMEALFTVLPIYDSILIYAQQKVNIQRKGVLIPDFDILIGSTSIHKELVLVTNNVKHMVRLEDVTIENWRSPEFNDLLK